MKPSIPQSHHHVTPESGNYRLTNEQSRLLESSFNQEKNHRQDLIFQLSQQLGMPAKQVSIWFHNKRTRWRTQNIHLDIVNLQVRLDTVMAEKAKLQKEVVELGIELKKAQEILSVLNIVGVPSAPHYLLHPISPLLTGITLECGKWGQEIKYPYNNSSNLLNQGTKICLRITWLKKFRDTQ
ncbi:hypothetical protein ACHQM5_006421 [Ranunculus cassubicifolius]